MIFPALIKILADAAQTVQTATAPGAPITVQSIILILGALVTLMTGFGTLAASLVNTYLTLRNGMKSDLNAAKADAHSVKQDATNAKLDGVSKALNGELDAKLNKLASTSYEAGVQSISAVAEQKAKEIIAAATAAAETQKLTA